MHTFQNVSRMTTITVSNWALQAQEMSSAVQWGLDRVCGDVSPYPEWRFGYCCNA